MSSPIVLANGFEYVVAGIITTPWLLVWQSLVVGRYRKSAKIPYPQLYAEKAEAAASKEAFLFNCAQRAHQNTLENFPIVVISALVAGLKYPYAAGLACGFWTLSRILYTLGYTTGDPKKRNTLGGGLGGLSVLGLGLCATWTTISFFL